MESQLVALLHEITVRRSRKSFARMWYSFPIRYINFRINFFQELCIFRGDLRNYFNDYDWFLKSDDDAYVIVENLRLLISKYDPSESIYFGHHFKVRSFDRVYIIFMVIFVECEGWAL